MSENDIQQLLKQGIEAAREGRRSDARALFEQVVEADETSEKGWFWLASVVDTEEEKRICLSNVVRINPQNERAQKALAALDDKKRRSRADEEVIPGITRRQLMLFAGGGGAVILLLVVIFIALSASRSAQLAAEAEQTQVAAANLTSTVVAQAELDAAATATQLAQVSPTPSVTPTPVAPTLPPEFTPTFTPTPLLSPTPLPPPQGVPGSIVAWGGRDDSQKGFLPIGLVPVSGGGFQPLSDLVGRNPDASRDGQLIVYTKFLKATEDYTVATYNVNTTQENLFTQGQPVFKAQMPAFCASANIIVFVALSTEGREINFSEAATQLFQVYSINLDSGEFLRLTNDRSIYQYPALSPDCNRIAVIKSEAARPGIGDIVVIDIPSRTQTQVTNDLDGFVESSPRWSPDGTRLIYAAYPANDPGNNDIIIRPADGSGTPQLPVRDAADDIHPIFSPDGRYIAFASDRDGTYNIYVYDLTGSTLYQLTSGGGDYYPGGWYQR